MTNTNYANDLALLTYTSTQGESQLYSLETAAGGIGLYLNANKTEYMHFNQKRAISTLSGNPLKSVHQFTYLSSNISSTERDINACLRA